MRKLLLLCLPFAATVAMAQKAEDAFKYANLITEKALQEKLSVIASADMEGRETATPGQKKAAAYIEQQFKRMGLKPGNGDSYQMYYPVYQDELTGEQLQVNGKTFAWDKDYSFLLNAISSGQWTYNNIVFAGYGMEDAANKIHDYAGLDAKGKIVLVLEGAPDNYPNKANTRFNPSSTYAKVNVARTQGAAGLLIVSHDFPKQIPTPFQGNMYLQRNEGASFVVGQISAEVASALLGRTFTLSADQFKEIPKGVYVAALKLMLQKKTNELQSSNVIGILPGTDKKDEYVFLTGHYDHLGKRGDVIYYGADDDGSGTTAVLQMAEAFTTAAKKGDKPRRTIVFMTVSGEEKGLWGSQYYSEHPIYPLDKTSVDLNTDMVGRIDTERKLGDTLNYVYVIGHDKLSSELAPINEGVNNKFTKLTLDYKYDDPKDPNRIYYRSDHYNFARKGVPILFFYDGMLLADYHKPTDTVDKINFGLMAKRVQMIFLTGWEMANRDNMLKRDTPLNMPSTR
ncbi:MAG: M28 family peptidase [Bacteroidota bacterium]|nr:M28 family peptidase [Bacteroidota bacterium]